ncbi:MAG: SDR family oxidoreductase [Verrucomicrobiales bacterium]
MLQQKRALVTGASSGIGRAVTEKLLAAGAEVIGLCRNPEALPAGVRAVACDLTDPEAVRTVFADLDGLDILVNNAGLALTSRVSDGDFADWEMMFRLNVLAVAQCCQLALPLFPEGGGQIVNVSSMSGHRVPPGGGMYAPSKFALKALSDALRNELRGEGRKTRVATVSPGYVDTPLLDKYFKGREAKLAEAKATMRLLQPEDVAASILHILEAPAHVDVTDVPLRGTDQAG